MPIVFRAIHTFTGSGQSVVGITMPVIKHIGGKYFRQRLLLHAGSDKEILERLDMYGVKGAHLGSYVGGRFTREMNGYLEWLENERRNEQEAAEQNAA